MAAASAHDVVNQDQSVGDLSPSDAPATQTNHTINGGGGGVYDVAAKNRVESTLQAEDLGPSGHADVEDADPDLASAVSYSHSPSLLRVELTTDLGHPFREWSGT